MGPSRTLAYPRRTLFAMLAVAALIGASSLALYGLPAPTPALALFTWSEAKAEEAPCDAFAESFFCGDGEDNDCDRDHDCGDTDCAWDSACGGCPWWDLSCSLPEVRVGTSGPSVWDRPRPREGVIRQLYGSGPSAALRKLPAAF